MQSPEPTSSRRKSVPSKRRIPVDSDDDEDEDVVMHELKRPQLKRSRKSYNLGTDNMDIEDDDDDVDVEIPTPSSARPAQANGKTSAKKSGTTKKKRTAVFTSDEDFVDPDRANSLSPAHPMNISDGDYESESAVRSKPVRQKTATWKVRAAGGVVAGTSKAPRAAAPKGAAGGSKGKTGKKDQVKEILMKDERRRTLTPPACRTSASQPQSQSQSLQDEDITLDIVNDEPESSLPASTSQLKEPSPPPQPKKKKLPTIRKNKPPVSTASAATTMPTQPISGLPSRPLVSITTEKGGEKDKIVGISTPTAAGARKPVVTSDFDLRDKSAWASLFKQVCI